MPFGPFLRCLGPFGYPLDIPWYWTLGWTLLLYILLLSITPLVCTISTRHLSAQISAQDTPEQFYHPVKQKSQIFHQLSPQKNIDKANVIEAFVTEEDNHLHCSNQSTMLANAKKSNLECRQTAKQEKKQTKKEKKVQQADTGAPPRAPEAELAESPFTVTSLSSHLSAHIASNASYLWCTNSGLLHI